ncbi:MAG: hypothetical protein IPN68_11335 [Bacteroidetes bacterium]|nr:hypothetical protein [Bacteroidota bacterium]
MGTSGFSVLKNSITISCSRVFIIWSLVMTLSVFTSCLDVKSRKVEAVIEAEEEVYDYIPANNGAGPMWCHGSTSIVRLGEKVYASGLETVPAWKILNNCRWMLFERSDSGWKKLYTDTVGRTREPAPMAAYHDGHFFLSANPTLTDTGAYNGPSRPEINQFNSNGDMMRFDRLFPEWADNPPFTEHSYRSLAADGLSSELILFQNIGYTHAEYSFLDRDGNWSAKGQLKWPWGSDYEVPEPIRVCYPNVMLKDRAVYFCGVSDIIEPKKAWREFKRELTGNEWDYDFRRLFYTWSDDITTGKFHDWIEIASREETCGWIYPGDLWVGPDGSVHILWTEKAIDERLREKFFPEARQSHSLNYALVRNGKVEVRTTIEIAEEGKGNLIPGRGRFHITPDNRILVLYFISGTDTAGNKIAENRIVEIFRGGIAGKEVVLPLRNPFTNFFTSTVRAGSQPSNLIDILGTPEGINNSIRYARILIR